MKRFLLGLFVVLYCLPVYAAGTKISDGVDIGPLQDTDRIPIGRVGDARPTTTTISTIKPGLATPTADGLMSKGDKGKVDSFVTTVATPDLKGLMPALTKYNITGTGGEVNDWLNVNLVYSGVSYNPLTYEGSALHVRSIANNNAVGTIHGISSHVKIDSSGNSGCEYTPLFLDTAATGSGRLWGTDQNVMGPIDTQADLMLGSSILVNNYNPASIPNGGYGQVLTTKTASGGGDLFVSRSTATTYPLTAGLAIIGYSGAPGTPSTNGWNTALQIGGNAGGWNAGSYSLIGTGIDVRDYSNYGVYIHGRRNGTGPSLAIHSDAGPVIIGQNTIRDANRLVDVVSYKTVSDSSATVYTGSQYDSYVTNSVDNNNLVVGLNGNAFSQGTGNFNSQIRGVQSAAVRNGSGSVDNLTGNYNLIWNNTSGTVNNAFGMVVDTISTGPSSIINTLYGIRINAPSGGTITNKYGVYVADSGMTNYFAGLVQSAFGGFKFPDGTIQTTAAGIGSLPVVTPTGTGVVTLPSVNTSYYCTGGQTGYILPANPAVGDRVNISEIQYSGGGSPSVTVQAGTGQALIINGSRIDNPATYTIGPGESVMLTYKDTGFWTCDAKDKAGSGSSQWTTTGSDIYYNTGKVGVGTTAPDGQVVIQNSDGSTTRGLYLDQLGDGTYAGSIALRKARGTTATKTAVQVADNVGAIHSFGYDGTGYINGASILFPVEVAPTTEHVPTAIRFDTAPVGGSRVERLRITSDGAIKIAGTSASLPAPSLTYRGAYWLILGDAVTNDRLYICLKSSTGAYNWILAMQG